MVSDFHNIRIWVIEVWNVNGDSVLFTASSKARAIKIAEEALKPYPVEVENGDRGFELTSTTLDEVFEVY